MKVTKTITPLKIIEEYFHWLCKMVHVEQRNESYWVLCRRLFDTEFKWYVLNDDNRAEDGLWLRDRFPMRLDEFFHEPCNMLEMLIALSERFDEIVHKEGDTDCIARYFWEMMDNCNLSWYSDSWFQHDIKNYKKITDVNPDKTGWDTSKIDKIIDNIINREYTRLGNCGLFPLKNSKKDQRKVELWYQLSEYINENYSIIDEKR